MKTLIRIFLILNIFICTTLFSPSSVNAVDPACAPGTNFWDTQQNNLIVNTIAAIPSRCSSAQIDQFKNFCCTNVGCKGASPTLDLYSTNPLAMANGPLLDCKTILDEVNASSSVTSKTYCETQQGLVFDAGTNSCVDSGKTGFALRAKMQNCATGGEGIPTAIGCVPTSDLGLTGKFLFTWVFAITGGIILLMAIFSAYTLITSSGDPKKLEAVKENFASIIGGLILIIFSVVLLQTIGVDIINIPGLF